MLSWSNFLEARVRDQRVQVSDRVLNAVQYPLPPIANLLSQSRPRSISGRSLHPCIRFPVLLGIDQSAQLDDMGDRVQFERICFATEPKRLQWDGAASGEYVEDLGAGRVTIDDFLDHDRASPLLRETFSMRFQYVPLGVRNHPRIPRVLAEALDE